MGKELTKEDCAYACQSWSPEAKIKPRHYPQFGVLAGTACFCGSYAANTVLSRPLSECMATKCSGNASDTCGGTELMMVYNYSCTPNPGPWQPPTSAGPQRP